MTGCYPHHLYRQLIVRLQQLVTLLLLLATCNSWAAQATSSPAPRSYLIGSGDEVRISVFGQQELTAEVQVSPQGTVQIPLLGSVMIAGKNSAEAAQMIAGRYEAGNFLKNAQVNLLVTKYRSQVVAILGRVNNPGKLVLEGPTSLTQALAAAGGIAATGSERLILTRTLANGRMERTEYDLQQMLNHAAEQQIAVWLRDGDTIYVPNAGRFYINGEVHSPGMFPLDRPLTIRQALSAGGGPTARASDSKVKVFRQAADGSVKELIAKPDDPVMDGDVLVVRESLF
uniref:polysaccharide biosynthesis/export family protein n=1 Tax=Cellvibrio fontiphilus TaxID=1815559 RepID=UPI002B4BE245|nr:polysaccharide biosynthesis/export family protein [Cellvibrio fontiphilus]